MSGIFFLHNCDEEELILHYYYFKNYSKIIFIYTQIVSIFVTIVTYDFYTTLVII